ncbi:hypothetical protein ABIE44_002755 [Marmoricola sp. OAE513]|uniref:ARPP-1 family domain-containing protein n=1 Tax=Marmoricola sp. OAE513 TaxID=2817894 RepID=UPI001AEA5B2D
MQNLHVGRGTDRGALSVFPIWGEYAGSRGYSAEVANATFGESGDGPAVDTLLVTNPQDKPLLMLEGQILEGGWQNRMLARSLMVAARAETPVDVVCVEAGRWGNEADGRAHRSFNRRGSARVRSALRHDGDRQGHVWQRITEYDGRVGANATSSFTEHTMRAERSVEDLVRGLRAFPGQVGVVIGLAGQPVAAEVFDSPRTLALQFESIVRAAALDALWLPSEPTPSRRARRFIDHACRVETRVQGPAGVGVTLTGRTPYADVAALGWRRREVHAVITNPRHALVAA